MKDLLTVQTAAKTLRITEQNVLYHIQQGNLKAQRLGHAWVIRRADFARFVSKRAK
jgi:excisionase family DNA binding protein